MRICLIKIDQTPIFAGEFSCGFRKILPAGFFLSYGSMDWAIDPLKAKALILGVISQLW